MLSVDIKFEAAEINKKLNKVSKQFIPAATRIGINEAVRNTESEAKTLIFNDVNKSVQRKKISENIRSRKVSTKAKDPSNMVGRVYSFGSRYSPIDHIGYRQVGKIGRPRKGRSRKQGGIKYKGSDGSTKFIASGFKARMPKSNIFQKRQHEAIFARGESASTSPRRDKHGKLRKNRLAIVQRDTFSTPSIFLDKKIYEKLRERALKDFAAAYNRVLTAKLKGLMR